ncbi:protein Csn12p homolog [[Candida] jaroonii]|uniref:Protein Csn12p homolog n=1 Tax=[Candida] jaroonii TaxID=467808 RepID=A0ACA9YCI9_9ASCO|nr:protein Csn12p homolog [[Candida] jaroonii]
MSLSEFIGDVRDALKKHNAAALCKFLEINPQDNKGPLIARFNDPNDFDLYEIDERFRNVIKSYIKLMKSIYLVNDIKKSFEDYNEMVIQLNRYAELQTNWINLTLMKCCKELIGIYSVMEKSFPEEIKNNNQSNEIFTDRKQSALEILANTINKSFKLSLNDKNLDLSQSKRIDIYFFLSILIKIYFKLGNIELAKSIEKALKGTRFELPAFNKKLKDKASAITYLYYSSILSLEDSDFKSSQSKLESALNLLSYYQDISRVKKNHQKILILLLPLKLYNDKKIPKDIIWKQFPTLKYLYKDNLFEFILKGQIFQLNNFIIKVQAFLLKSNLYLLFENLKRLCMISLIKKTVHIHQSLNEDTKTNHIIPFSAFNVTITYSTHGKSQKDYTENFDEIECILASLIADGFIKGYLSHSNKCIVLSKTVPFP